MRSAGMLVAVRWSVEGRDIWSKALIACVSISWLSIWQHNQDLSICTTLGCIAGSNIVLDESG